MSELSAWIGCFSGDCAPFPCRCAIEPCQSRFETCRCRRKPSPLGRTSRTHLAPLPAERTLIAWPLNHHSATRKDSISATQRMSRPGADPERTLRSVVFHSPIPQARRAGRPARHRRSAWFPPCSGPCRCAVGAGLSPPHFPRAATAHLLRQSNNVPLRANSDTYICYVGIRNTESKGWMRT